jgi:hypothetical protein
MRSLPARSAGGSTRPRCSSSICFSFTQEPSQDPFGRAGGVASLTEAAPFPLSGMVAEQARNPSPAGMKLGSGGFQMERMLKEEEKWATGAQL